MESLPRPGGRGVHTLLGQLALFRSAGDEIFAVQDICRLRAAPLLRNTAVRRIGCAAHDWVLALDTGENRGWSRDCALRLPVRVVHGVIMVEFALDT